MSLFDEFRRSDYATALVRQIHASLAGRTARFMEVCGGHTMAIWRYGLPQLLRERVILLSGPGCPVCVTPNAFLDHAIALARLPQVIIVTFGDLMRVPGSTSDLQTERARGADIRPVYSARDALAVAKTNPEKKIVFLGIGFETTAPTIAATVLEAQRIPSSNFYLLSALKTMPQALRAIASGGDVQLDGLILPGHVSTITGCNMYQFLADEFHLPGVISGFEPLDILQSIALLAQQIKDGRAEVENQYTRSARREGNQKALEIMHAVFDPGQAEWRGLGWISDSGLELKAEFASFDAASLEVEVEPCREPPGCRCGDVIRGALPPEECRLFGDACTPDHPAGACMVSEEGTCAAHYKYRQLS